MITSENKNQEYFHITIYSFLNGVELSRCRCLDKYNREKGYIFWKPRYLSNETLINYYNGFFQKIFEEDKIICRLIHGQEDICFNSLDREILLSIKKLFGDVFYFKESMFGKCIYCSVKKFHNIIRNSFEIDFKILNQSYIHFYQKRINTIIHSLIVEKPSLRNNDDYLNLVSQLPSILSELKTVPNKQIISLTSFYNYREQWEQFQKEI